MASAFLQGLMIGGGLIIAIGPQNTFVLSQGIRREYVFLSALVCTLCDALLISMGVLGLGAFFSSHPHLILLARVLGAGFLITYGWMAFRAARRPKVLQTSAPDNMGKSAKQIIGMLLGLSLLNPHAYLDAVVLLGSLSAQHAGGGRYRFGLGAICASATWFFSLSYGATRLTPLFKSARAWQFLDSLIGLTMWGIALMLILPILPLL